MVRFKNLWSAARGTLVLHAAVAAITWFTLPSRIPTHFGASGTADAWGPRSLFGWFTLVAVSLFAQCLIHLLTSPGARDSWNIPEKERFLQLTPARQEPVLELMRIFGGFSALGVTLTMLILQIGMYLPACGITKGLPWYIMVAMFVPMACMLLAMIPWSKAVKRAILSGSP